MTLEQHLAALKAEGRLLLAKANDPKQTFTEADAARATALARETQQVEEQMWRAASASEALQRAVTGGIELSSDDNNTAPDDGRTPFRAKARKAAGTLQGQQAKAAEFAGNLMKALEQAAPTIGGPAVNKALIPQGAVTAGFDGRVIADPKAEHSLVNAVNSRPVETPNGSYLRQTSRDNNAGAVVNGALKPLSGYGLEPVTWEICTVAHLSEPIQLQWLADYSGLSEFLASEMTFGVEEAVSDFLLNGATSEEGNPVAGILTTTGVVQTAYTSSALRTVRASLGQLEAAGITATGIVLNPLDWEDIETTLDADGRFLLSNAPTAAPARTLWNVPVTLAVGMPRGQAIVGDLSTITLLHRSSLMLAWNPYAADLGTQAAPQITDLFRRNQAQFRAEVRVGLELTSPKSLRVAVLTPA
jgi:HK97 family phage major capsid protein